MTSLQSPFQELLEQQLAHEFGKPEAEDAFQKVRMKSRDHFKALGLPSRKMEVYRYIKLRKLYEQQFHKAEHKTLNRDTIGSYTLPGLQKSLLVFVNGHYHPELSCLVHIPSKVAVLPMEKAVHTYGAFLNNHLAKSLKMETDPFVSLNGALQQKGVFLYIPPNTAVEQPIQILNLIDVELTPSLLNPRIHIFVSKQSKTELYFLNETVSGENYLCNQCLDISLEEGAAVKMIQSSLGSPKSAWIFEGVRVSMKRDSLFHSAAITDGAGTIRSDYRVELNGENAEASLNGLWMLKGAREAHTNVLIDHQAPHCRSLQLFKGVLDDTSTSSFEGKIFVRQAAQKTDAFQLNNNLLLSDKANADSKPNLEIFADDVKASHGATVGQLDSEHLFYLRSRGYSDTLAKSILTKGFCQEVLDLIKYEPLHDQIQKKLTL